MDLPNNSVCKRLELARGLEADKQGLAAQLDEATERARALGEGCGRREPLRAGGREQHRCCDHDDEVVHTQA